MDQTGDYPSLGVKVGNAKVHDGSFITASTNDGIKQ
jgi:hypothetical protein